MILFDQPKEDMILQYPLEQDCSAAILSSFIHYPDLTYPKQILVLAESV